MELQQLLECLYVDVQAAMQAESHAYPLSACVNVKEHERGLCRPVRPTKCHHTHFCLEALFLLLNFSDAGAVRLMLLGMRDSHAVGCMMHGWKITQRLRQSEIPLTLCFAWQLIRLVCILKRSRGQRRKG